MAYLTAYIITAHINSVKCVYSGGDSNSPFNVYSEDDISRLFPVIDSEFEHCSNLQNQRRISQKMIKFFRRFEDALDFLENQDKVSLGNSDDNKFSIVKVINITKFNNDIEYDMATKQVGNEQYLARFEDDINEELDFTIDPVTKQYTNNNTAKRFEAWLVFKNIQIINTV